MNGHSKWVAIAFGILVNVAAVFYWGGTTRSSLDHLSEDFRAFSEQSIVTDTEHTSSIASLATRLSVMEATGPMCSSDG